jgi:methyl acetate hydrolase
VGAKTVPGVVAVAATDRGVLYEGAFGQREVSKPAPMNLDTVVWIASMTKEITATAAMQLVERGNLTLERPAGEVVPEIGAAKVLEGYDAAGKPRLRAPKRAITLRHLLTHTAGFSYEIWNTSIAQFQQVTGTPGITTCTNAALSTPLVFDPGDKWEYGISIDWVGKMVEAMSGQKLDRYFQDNFFGPLGIKDTSFKLSDEPVAEKVDDSAVLWACCVKTASPAGKRRVLRLLRYLEPHRPLHEHLPRPRSLLS